MKYKIFFKELKTIEIEGIIKCKICGKKLSSEDYLGDYYGKCEGECDLG